MTRQRVEGDFWSQPVQDATRPLSSGPRRNGVGHYDFRPHRWGDLRPSSSAVPIH